MEFKEVLLAILTKIKNALIIAFLFIKKWAIIIFKKVRKAIKKYVRKLVKRTKSGDYSMLIYTGVGLLIFILLICLMVSCSSKKKNSSKENNDTATSTDSATSNDVISTEDIQNILIQNAKNAYEQDKNFLTLVNINTQIPDGYTFEQHLLNSGKIVDERIYNDLLTMLNDCNAAGFEYTIVSGYVSRESQTSTYNDKVSSLVSQGYTQEQAESTAAAEVFAPGHNEHETGLAID
ncbi:MAG: D-alanyl-D-alanine carboxypeptidase family protein, partial [Wujia sp.]